MKKDSRNKEACCAKVILIKNVSRAYSFWLCYADYCCPLPAEESQLSHAMIKGGKGKRVLG